MEKKNNWKAWLYLAPALILMGLFTFFPILNTFITSFLKDYNYITGENSGFTFENYGIILGITENVAGIAESKNYTFIRYALPNTLIITFVTVPISVLLSLLIALGLNRIKVFRSFFQTVFFLPYVTNTIAVGMVFSLMFSNTGIINELLGLGNLNWIQTGSGASYGRSMFVLCLYVIWSALPYKILIFSSGLAGIDQQYYDAARIDGAGRFKTDMKVTLPLLSPQILYISITSFISGFKEYNSVVGLFNRSYTADANTNDLYTVVYYIYDQIRGVNGTRKIALASAGAVILFIIIFALTLVQMAVSRKRVHYS